MKFHYQNQANYYGFLYWLLVQPDGVALRRSIVRFNHRRTTHVAHLDPPR